MREVNFLNSQIGWTVGAVLAPPFILNTADGGGKWNAQSLQPPQNDNSGIESLSLLDENTAWAVGRSGRVYKYDARVSVRVEAGHQPMAPLQFRLAPNQPNPVKTSTRFDYTISQAASVRLAVYDVLGREVARLFSGEKSPGVYSVFWDGRDHHDTLLPNGVYFYRLHAGDLILTRKLVLRR